MVMVSGMATGTAMATAMVEGSETATLAPSRMRQETKARARERAKPNNNGVGKGDLVMASEQVRQRGQHDSICSAGKTREINRGSARA